MKYEELLKDLKFLEKQIKAGNVLNFKETIEDYNFLCFKKTNYKYAFYRISKEDIKNMEHSEYIESEAKRLKELANNSQIKEKANNKKNKRASKIGVFIRHFKKIFNQNELYLGLLFGDFTSIPLLFELNTENRTEQKIIIYAEKTS